MASRTRIPRQNLFAQSEALATAPWADDGTATRTNNYTSAPDGTNTATRVQFAGGGTQYIYQTGINWQVAQFYTVSAWMRATSGTATVRFRNKSGALNSTLSQGPNITLDTTWRRYSFTSGPNTFVGTTGFIVLAIMNDSSGNAADFLVWGAQLEQSNFVGEYIKTTTVPINASNPPRNSLLKQNLVLQSEGFDTTSWTTFGNNTIITADAVIAPDGNQTADNMFETTANGIHNVRQVVTTSAANTYTFSVYAKFGAVRSWLLLNDGDGNANAWFNLSTGIRGSKNGATLDWGMESAGNGWYRCFITFAGGATGAAIYLDTANGSGNAYIGDTSAYISLWGAQIVQANWAGPYVKTTSSVINGSSSPRNLIRSRNSIQGQNLFVQSEALNVSWNLTNLSATVNVALAPDGNQTADRLTDNTTNGVHAFSESGRPTIVGNIYTVSAYFKYENHPLIVIGGNGGDSTAYVYVNMQTGTIVSSVGTNIINYGIENAGNGWYRAWNTYIANVNATAPTFYWAQSVGVLSYAGTGTDTMLIWGLQMVQGNWSGIYTRTTTVPINASSALRNKLTI